VAKRSVPLRLGIGVKGGLGEYIAPCMKVDFVDDKRRNRLYSHTAFAGESDLHWFARKHTPLGLVFKEPEDLNTLVKKLDKMAPPFKKQKRQVKQTKLNFRTVSKAQSANPRHPSNSPIVTRAAAARAVRQERAMRSIERRLVRRNRVMAKYHGRRSRVGYRGRMKRGSSTKVWNDPYNQRGVTTIHEVTYEASDPNCIYAFADVVRPKDGVYYAIAAVIRHLMEKAGLRATAFDEYVVIPGGTTDIYFNLVKYNAYSTAFSNTAYTCTSTSTFRDVVNAFGVDFANYVSGYGALSASNTLELISMSIEKRVGSSSNVAVTQVPLAEVQLGELFIHVRAKSQLKIQNRTVGTMQVLNSEDVPTTVADFNSEGVHANSLVGRSYVFNGVPKLKTYGQVPGVGSPSANQFLRVDWVTGINKFGATYTGTNDFKTAPDPKIFWNCKASAKQRLEPGELKSLYGGCVFKKKLLKYLQMLKYEENSGQYSQTVFPILGVAFEDVMNLNGSFSCTIGMCIERKLGMFVSEKKQKWFRTEYSDDTV